MGKIGICACYNSFNYGSMLQAFATQIAIEKLGYESEYIVYYKKKGITSKIKQIPRIFNMNLVNDKMLVIKKKINLYTHPEIKERDNIRKKAFEKFKDNYYYQFSTPYYGFGQLCEGAKKYSTVLVGSDQLWTPGGLATNFYNLMFVPENINKVSYATSFGVNHIPWYQIKRTRRYLSRINHLSVREIRGVEIVKDICGKNAKIVVDPTLLLTSDEWIKYIPEKKLINESYIFCYFLGTNTEHRKLAQELKRRTGLKIVVIPFLDSFIKSDLKFGDLQLYDIGPDDFVNLIRNAEYIITDSFHGSIFSIIYHKKFAVVNRYSNSTQSRNSRISSLIKLTGLESCYLYDNTLGGIKEEINYDMVDKKIRKLREESILFLENSLQ